MSSPSQEAQLLLVQQQVDQIVEATLAQQKAVEQSREDQKEFRNYIVESMESHRKDTDRKLEKMTESLEALAKTVSDIHIMQNEQVHLNTRTDENAKATQENTKLITELRIDKEKYNTVVQKDQQQDLEIKELKGRIDDAERNLSEVKANQKVTIRFANNIDKLVWGIVITVVMTLGGTVWNIVKKPAPQSQDLKEVIQLLKENKTN